MRNSELPKITIITPVKNSVKTLEKAIQSLIAQNYPNIEYIVLDGESNDGTVDIIKKYERYIDVFESKNDGGSVQAYIEGIKKATHDIIAFLNADDFYEPEILLKAGQEFASNPTLDMVSFRYRVINQDSVIIEESSLEDIELEENKTISSLGINARFFKKDLFYRHGFPISIDDQKRSFISNDLEYMIRFLIKGVNNKSINYVGYNYLSHPESLTFNNNPLKNQRFMEDRIFIAKNFLSQRNNLSLTKFWQKTFIKWIQVNRAKLVKSDLKLERYKEAKNHFFLGMQEANPIRFIIYLIKTLLRS